MPKQKCTVNGCYSFVSGRGYCGKHYARFMRHGDPLAVKYSVQKSARVDDYIKTLTANCRHHGDHKDWRLRNRVDVKGRQYRSIECNLCVKSRAKKWRDKNPELHKKSMGTITVTASRLVSGAKRRAEKSGIPFSITRDWVVSRFELQGGVCALSGRPFQLEYGSGGRRSNALSLDQIVPGNGYTAENTQLVLWCVNEMKKRTQLDVFVLLCRDIAHHMQKDL